MLSKDICRKCYYEEYPLSAARPIYQSVWCCVEKIRKADYSTINEYSSPPKGCHKLFEHLIYDTHTRGERNVK